MALIQRFRASSTLRHARVLGSPKPSHRASSTKQTPVVAHAALQGKQEHRRQDPANPRPRGFDRKKSESHAGGKGVLGILGLLIDDSESMVESIVKAEETARKAYSTDLEMTQHSMEEKDQHKLVLPCARKSGQTGARLPDWPDCQTGNAFFILGNLPVPPVAHKWISPIWFCGCYGLHLH